MADASGTLGPDGDDFYYPTTIERDGAPGEVVWYRPLTSRAAVKAEDGTPRWQNELVLYRSRDVRNQPIFVSGIIVLPDTPVPKGGYPVISWAHGTVGCADRCAPSRDELEDAQPMNAYPHALLRAFLEQGWAVVMTDYEGLGTDGLHPYLLGESEAHGILDMVRAARNRYPDKIGSRFQIVGHSQGGQAALFGAHHAPTYAPELQLLGVAAIAPASATKLLVSLGAITDALDENGGYAFTALFLAGAIGGDPSINPAEVLSEKALAFWPHVEERARKGLSAPDSWGSLKGTEQLRAEDSASKRAFFEQLERTHPALTIAAPIRIAQALQDTRIKAALTIELLRQLRALNGDDAVTDRIYGGDDDPVVVPNEPGDLGYHFGTIKADIPEMIAWLTGNWARGFRL